MNFILNSRICLVQLPKINAKRYICKNTYDIVVSYNFSGIILTVLKNYSNTDVYKMMTNCNATGTIYSSCVKFKQLKFLVTLLYKITVQDYSYYYIRFIPKLEVTQ